MKSWKSLQVSNGYDKDNTKSWYDFRLFSLRNKIFLVSFYDSRTARFRIKAAEAKLDTDKNIIILGQQIE